MTVARQQHLVFGPEVTPLDRKRLARQQEAVERVMASGLWLTLRELADRVGAGEPSVSARLRDCRKRGFTVDKRRLAPGSGIWLYRLARP